MTRAESEAGAAAHPGPSLLPLLLMMLLMLLLCYLLIPRRKMKRTEKKCRKIRRA